MTRNKPKPLLQRNPGTDFQLERFCDIQINRSAVEQRCASYGKRRSIKKDNQAAWLLKVISLIDLTTLAGDDTRDRVRRLCRKALNPVNEQLIRKLELETFNLSTAAVCVYHEMLSEAATLLKGTGVHLAAVSTGFPAGLSPLPLRIEEIKYSENN